MKTLALLYTTMGSIEEAEKIAEKAITEKYAACINIIPNTLSVYTFEEKIEKSTECLLLFKTDVTCIQKLQEWLTQNHPYTLPAILIGQINSSDAFTDYVKTSVKTVS